MKKDDKVVESTMTEGVSVIRSTKKRKKNTKIPEPKKLRVAAYCRVSKDIEVQESSIETQMETYDRLISQHPDWELVEIYADKGKTGTSTKKRTAFLKMKEDAEAGKIDKILVKSISRFCRNTVDLLNTIREFRALGVGVVFEKENLDTTSLESELLLTVYAAFAQEESFSISENMRGGIRQRFKLGIPKVSVVYGYDNLTRGVLTINEEKAEVVRRIFQMNLDGCGAKEIVKILNAEGVKPPIETGQMWYPHSIRSLIRNEKYAGDSLMQKYYTSNHLEHDITSNKDCVVEQYYKEGTHEAIVPRDVYEDANRVILMRDSQRGACQYPYYGRLLCPHCGKPMVKVNVRFGRSPSCWICGGEDKGEFYGERTDCPIYWVKEPYLSNAVIDAIMDIDVNELDENDAKKVVWVQEQLEAKPTVEFGYLKRIVEYITFKDWNTMKIVWTWGGETLTPYSVERPADYPDLTVHENRIGPFNVIGQSLDNVIRTIEKAKQIIRNTRIIADTSRLYSCPPFVVSGQEMKE